MAQDALAEGVNNLVLLQTHYHHDHTQGFMIAPPAYIGNIPVGIYGPKANGYGPRQVYETIFEPPFHPVSLSTLKYHLKFHDIENPTTRVFVIHPQGGIKFMEIEQYNRLITDKKMLPFHEGKKFSVDECLVITMHQTVHPEQTIAFRFDEKPTGKSFVFLTDEECRASIPISLSAFLDQADLLIQDAQYSHEEFYVTRTKAGFGHGTPSYVIKTALLCGVKKVGFFHHDPNSTDERVELLVNEGEEARGDNPLEIFACADYQSIKV